MADTKAPSVQKYVDYAQQQVDEQAILDKYNAATLAQFNIQREQNRANENAFYNQMYNTQKTAMDTIRQSNAAAVSTGASRGVQAANELSALLGLQQESVASATELAQANRQTAQEETAAVLENVLAAYQQAAQERSQLVTQGIEAASVDAQTAANEVAAMDAQTNRMNVEQNEATVLGQAIADGTDAYLTTVNELGKDYASAYSAEGENSLNTAMNGLTVKTPFPTEGEFGRSSFSSPAVLEKTVTYENTLKALCQTYGIDYNLIKSDIDTMKNIANNGGVYIRSDKVRDYSTAWNNVRIKITNAYKNKQ